MKTSSLTFVTAVKSLSKSERELIYLKIKTSLYDCNQSREDENRGTPRNVLYLEDKKLWEVRYTG